MGLFSSLGKLLTAPFKAVSSVVGLPFNLLKSAPSLLKGTGSAVTDVLSKLIPVAASAGPALGAAIPGIGPILGMLGGGLGGGLGSTMTGHNKILAQIIPRLAQQLTGGTSANPLQMALGRLSQGLTPGFGA